MKRAMLLAGCVAVLSLSGCGDDGSADPPTESSTAEATTTSSTASTGPAEAAPDDSAPSDSAPPGTASTTTTTIAAAPPSTGPAPAPGEPCEVGTVDCVEDAWGDGVARTIVGYDECYENVGGSGLCEDLDRDGYAGYPDSG